MPASCERSLNAPSQMEGFKFGAPWFQITKPEKKILDFPMALLFETSVLRRSTKTQKYNGMIFEQLESGWEPS